jgi:hypothetical protein
MMTFLFVAVLTILGFLSDNSQPAEGHFAAVIDEQIPRSVTRRCR